MSSEDSSENQNKKLKVIDWRLSDSMANEVESDFVGAEDKPRSKWIPRTLLVGMAALLVFVGVRGWQVYQEIQEEAATAQVTLPPEFQAMSGQGGLSSGFVSRPRAQLARDDSYEKLLDARRAMDGNPMLMQRLLVVEKTFQEGDRLLRGRNYTAAFERFQETEMLLDGFNSEVINKNEAFAARDDFLVLKDRIDPHRNLDRDTYENAYILFSEGLFFLDNGSFFEAKRRFEDALERMSLIEGRLGEYKDRQLREGQAALADGDTQGAFDAFNRVLEIDDRNEVARRGLKRAETLDRVFPMLEQARAFENEGQLVRANDLYVSAYELDPLSARAQEGAVRTERMVKDMAFNNALAEAVEAAEQSNWHMAIEATKKALEVYPDNEDVKERLKEFRQLEFDYKVSSALARGRDFERAREWRLAQAAYEEALRLDSRNQTAIAGIRRTGDVGRALIRYQRLIELAQVEAVDNLDFQASINYFNEAMSIKPDYLPLGEDAERLKDFLQQQSRPVSLRITSDNRTWVSISGYDHLGQFRDKEVKILPGRYRIVGRRRGFEDVVQQVTIIAGQGMWLNNQKISGNQINVVPTQRSN